jgi:hypothetical protein
VKQSKIDIKPFVGFLLSIIALAVGFILNNPSAVMWLGVIILLINVTFFIMIMIILCGIMEVIHFYGNSIINTINYEFDLQYKLPEEAEQC